MQILCIAVLASACAHADEFSWQFVATARDSDVARAVEADGASLSATYYFRPVDDSAGPYALAPFLERSSRVGATYSEDKTTALVPVISIGPPVPLPPQPPVTLVTRAAGRSLSGRYVWRDSGWYVGAGLFETDAAHPAPLPTEFSVLGDDLTTRSLTFGKYVARSTAVELSASTAESTLTSELPLYCAPGTCYISPIARLTARTDTELDTVELSARHVGLFGRFAYSLSGGVTANETNVVREVVETPLQPAPPVLAFPMPDIGTAPPGPFEGIRSSSARAERYTLAGELYPTPALGVRVGYARWNGEDALDERYDIGATWFVRRRIGVQLAWSKTESRLPIMTVTDIETVTLQLIGRL